MRRELGGVLLRGDRHVAFVPEPSVKHYGLVPVKTSAALREAAREWPSDELFLVTHRALRNAPRVRVLWDLLIERVANRAAPPN